MVVGAVVVLLRKVPGQLWTFLQRRGRRYATNHRQLLAGMRRLEFAPFLDPAIQSFIITASH